MKIAIVGAGWSGLSAAIQLREYGHQVVVMEAGHTPGGRARRVAHPHFDHPLDNGQHILLGAYTHTLALMRKLDRSIDTLLLRVPLRLASLDGRFRLAAARLPVPLNLGAALLTARGLSLPDRWAALRLVQGLTRGNWRIDAAWTVADLMRAYRQPADLKRKLWEPLCLAALNTPVHSASAALYATVLRDTLSVDRAHSDLLLPRTDLSALWADAAAARCDVNYGATVRSLAIEGESVRVGKETFDRVLLTIAPHAAARLLDRLPATPGGDTLLAQLRAFAYQPIATLNLQLARPWKLPTPMMLLTEDPARGHDGQWLFDRAQLAGRNAGPSRLGELAVVVSAAQGLLKRDRDEVVRALCAQVAEQARTMPPMPAILASELFIDKHATFSAVPGLARPAAATPWPNVFLAGDWTDTGYPGVLEGAVLSGGIAARVLSASCDRSAGPRRSRPANRQG